MYFFPYIYSGNIPKGIEDLRKLTSFNIQDNQSIQGKDSNIMSYHH